MKIAFRPQQITIDAIKPSSPPLISLLIQRLELDENNQILATSDFADRVYRNAFKNLAETIEFIDPITGLSGEVSIAGLNKIIRLWANAWVSEDLNLEIDIATGWATQDATDSK